MERLLYDCREAAKLLSISIRSLDYLIVRKQLTIRRIGRRVLVPYRSLMHFARSNHLSPEQDSEKELAEGGTVVARPTAGERSATPGGHS
jgi:hypothetical protein